MQSSSNDIRDLINFVIAKSVNIPLVAMPWPAWYVCVIPKATTVSHEEKYCLNSVGSSSSLMILIGVLGFSCLAERNPLKTKENLIRI